MPEKATSALPVLMAVVKMIGRPDVIRVKESDKFAARLGEESVAGVGNAAIAGSLNQTNIITGEGGERRHAIGGIIGHAVFRPATFPKR